MKTNPLSSYSRMTLMVWTEKINQRRFSYQRSHTYPLHNHHGTMVVSRRLQAGVNFETLKVCYLRAVSKFWKQNTKRTSLWHDLVRNYVTPVRFHLKYIRCLTVIIAWKVHSCKCTHNVWLWEVNKGSREAHSFLTPAGAWGDASSRITGPLPGEGAL